MGGGVRASHAFFHPPGNDPVLFPSSPLKSQVSFSSDMQCYLVAWMGGEFGGELIHVYVWLRPFAVHLKLSQHC